MLEDDVPVTSAFPGRWISGNRPEWVESGFRETRDVVGGRCGGVTGRRPGSFLFGVDEHELDVRLGRDPIVDHRLAANMAQSRTRSEAFRLEDQLIAGKRPKRFDRNSVFLLGPGATHFSYTWGLVFFPAGEIF